MQTLRDLPSALGLTKTLVSSQPSFSRLGIVQTLRDLPSALGLTKTLVFLDLHQSAHVVDKVRQCDVTYGDIAASRHIKQACSALDFRNVGFCPYQSTPPLIIRPPIVCSINPKTSSAQLRTFEFCWLRSFCSSVSGWPLRPFSQIIGVMSFVLTTSSIPAYSASSRKSA